jgi:imidazolonepropionase-like amidohydrolase
MFVVRGARVFDGVAAIEHTSVLVAGTRIVTVSDRVAAPHTATEIDGHGLTLVPGLIDAHTHAQPPALEHALVFGVTTELDMFSMSSWMEAQKADAAARNDMADVRSAFCGVTVLGGHPSFLIGPYFSEQFPTVGSVTEVPRFVAERVAEGADYIKIFIEDGAALGYSCPTLTQTMAAAVSREAHRYGKLALAHATSLAGFRQAIDAGVDGIVHVFVDQPPTDEVIQRAVDAGIFVIPTLSTLAAVTQEPNGAVLANDPRASQLLPDDWHRNLCRCWRADSPGELQYALDATRSFHEAGVPILAGTDAACIGAFGTAHGVSLHGELQLLVRAGLSPSAALRAATAATADAFGLDDRGRIAEGRQADLLLIDGDPTSEISDTLSINSVWRRGEWLDRRQKAAALQRAI